MPLILFAMFLVAVLSAALLGRELLQLRGELAGEQAAVIESSGEVELLRAELSASRAAEAELRSEVDAGRGEIARLVRELDRARAEAAAVEERSAEAQAALRESEAGRADLERLSQTQAQQVEALKDCLNGYRVAFEFARSGASRSAELALSSVSVACGQVSELF